MRLGVVLAVPGRSPDWDSRWQVVPVRLMLLVKWHIGVTPSGTKTCCHLEMANGTRIAQDNQVPITRQTVRCIWSLRNTVARDHANGLVSLFGLTE